GQMAIQLKPSQQAEVFAKALQRLPQIPGLRSGKAWTAHIAALITNRSSRTTQQRRLKSRDSAPGDQEKVDRQPGLGRLPRKRAIAHQGLGRVGAEHADQVTQLVDGEGEEIDLAGRRRPDPEIPILGRVEGDRTAPGPTSVGVEPSALYAP